MRQSTRLVNAQRSDATWVSGQARGSWSRAAAVFSAATSSRSCSARRREDIFIVRQRDYDLTREDQVARLFAEHPADVVLHLAGYVGGIGANKARPADFFYRNIMMNTLTLHHAWKSGVNKSSSAAAGCGYPEHAPIPLKESDFWDGFPQEVSAPYSLAKRMLQVQASAYWRQHSSSPPRRSPAISTVLTTISISKTRTSSPRWSASLSRPWTTSRSASIVWGTGTPTRDFVYAGDVAEGILRAAEVYEHRSIVNLSSGKETSIADVVHALADITRFAGQIVWDTSRPDGQSRRLFDVSKAAARLGWRRARRCVRDWRRRSSGIAPIAKRRGMSAARVIV